MSMITPYGDQESRRALFLCMTHLYIFNIDHMVNSVNSYDKSSYK